jgi:uncharacterized membrane protein
LVKGTDRVGRQIVQHHPDALCPGKVNICEITHAGGEVDCGAAVSDFDLAPGSMHVVGGPVALILAVLPLPLPFFALLVGAFLVVLALIQIGILRYVFLRIGISSRAAMFLLLASLIGSYINIPIVELPERDVQSGIEISFFGMQYVVPAVVEWPGTVIAVNVGGAVIPGLLSLYLLFKNRMWLTGLIATAVITAIVHLLAYPVPGVGIAVPVFVPPIATALVALPLARENAAALAYVSGSLGTLIGADLLNLDAVRGLGAPVASIGGAGTFDGIFLTGIMAVLLAGFPRRA